ncbi:MAG: GH25 family lysozyme [Acidobacteriota bacterium]
MSSQTTEADLTYEGIDVSHYQGDVDWEKVKAAGMTFAFAKASQGATNVDSKFSTNWAAMRQAGIVRGAYHFFDADVDATAQADHFIATVQLEAGDLPPVIDAEVTDGVSTEGIDQGVQTWLDKVSAHYGVKPIVYSGASFITSHLSTGFNTYPLWLARYTSVVPEAPGDWSSWTFWQYSQSGDVDGVAGSVDRDRFQGTAEAWQSLLVPASS